MDRDSSDTNLKPEVPDGDSNDNTVISQSQVTRRRALIAGLVAMPVLMTIMRRSAWSDSPQPSCSIVASYVNSGNRFVSPQLPGHNVSIDWGDRQRCQR